MPHEVAPSLNERDFIRKALRENVRLDGRALDQYRELDLSFGDEYGVVDVRLGRTRVLVRISATVTTPFPDRKFDGIFTISTELSPLADPAFEAGGRPTATETLLSRLLEKCLRRSGALDTESLCIVAGSKCFAVRADVHVLDHDGGLLDAACVGVVAGLLHFRRPDVEVRGEEVRVFSPREREPVRLSMQHQPFCVSFSYYGLGGSGGKDGEEEEEARVVLDADLSEERVRDGEVVVSVNRHGEVAQIAKYGGKTVDPVVVVNCVNVAVEKVKGLHKFVMGRLEEDEKRRDRGGLMAELSAENER